MKDVKHLLNRPEPMTRDELSIVSFIAGILFTITLDLVISNI